jgi:sigma-B regulation protein RsbU (phosphoserine phosphatase)
MIKRQTTIFSQLIINVVGPAVLALLVLGAINYVKTRNILVNSNKEKNAIITDEITHIIELEDLALEILQNELNKRMEEISNRLVYDYFLNTNNIESADLVKIHRELGLNPEFEDIYIINRRGFVVNTTFQEDMGKNFFDFGLEHKNLLLQIWENGEFFPERFTIEDVTKRLRKYTYQPTVDGKFIIELGIYSVRADEIIQMIKDRINGIAHMHESIQSVDLFIGVDEPFSLNNKDAHIPEDHIPFYRQVITDGIAFSTREKTGRDWIDYQYMFMSREHTDLYRGSVIRIISDYSKERKMLRTELFVFMGIFLTTLLIVVLLLYLRTKVITDPIKKLVMNVNRITDGHLNERAEVVGRNEITRLSEKFNMMIAQLESYTNELEEKVKERTAEIEKQKEEISAQRDSLEEQRNMLSDANANLATAYKEIEAQKRHIEDSIHYAKRIQNAILPPDEFVKNVLREHFIFYLPKDIVSGDFYWLTKMDSRVYVAAVDCTGHGVPGAFMSIVGHDQLNYSVNVVGARKPSEILNALNKGVTNTLRQSRAEISVKDGMDIALCRIDYKNMKLEYSGAFNPLYLVRNNELIQVDANKFPIGAFVEESLQVFTNHEIEMEEGDVFYIFSDGYQDQFGGPKNKKFLTKRFRELLLEISSNPMDKQREKLEKRFLDWKKDLVQVDDILVIGIQI